MRGSSVLPLALLAVVVGASACDDRGTGRRVDGSVATSGGAGGGPSGGSSGAAGADAGQTMDVASPGDPQPDAAVDAEPPHATGTFELPRIPADATLTRRLVPGVANLVGSDRGSCTHAPGATPAGDRWCAFRQPVARR